MIPVEAVIEKPKIWKVTPNLLNYSRAKAEFTWEDARRELSGLPGGKGLNIAYEAVDRHVEGQKKNQVAIR